MFLFERGLFESVGVAECIGDSIARKLSGKGSEERSPVIEVTLTIAITEARTVCAVSRPASRLRTL